MKQVGYIIQVKLPERFKKCQCCDWSRIIKIRVATSPSIVILIIWKLKQVKYKFPVTLHNAWSYHGMHCIFTKLILISEVFANHDLEDEYTTDPVLDSPSVHTPPSVELNDDILEEGLKKVSFISNVWWMIHI